MSRRFEMPIVLFLLASVIQAVAIAQDKQRVPIVDDPREQNIKRFPLDDDSRIGEHIGIKA